MQFAPIRQYGRRMGGYFFQEQDNKQNNEEYLNIF
jgi:hypothetical protein